MHKQVADALEVAHARGLYEAKCVGPADPADGQRLADYLLEHPEMEVLYKTPFVEIARRLGIPLVEKWSETFENLWTTQGKNDCLDKYFAGSAYTAAFYVGLISSVSYSTVAAADVAAQINGTNAWKEGSDATNTPTYSNSTRVALTFAAASGGAKAVSAPSGFSITGTGTVKGCFATTASGKAATTGVLVTAGLFSGGDKPVSSGDTLNVSWTGSI